ncbi:MAG TPA: BON domain-containing protein [Candidatus Manganitrophaceae bacterium]|nr:BON domain-containing protein [Candidatus Manganitrophaceae bacterium]
MKRLMLVFLVLMLIGTGCGTTNNKKTESRPSNKSVEGQIRNKLKTDPMTSAWEINPTMEGNTITLVGLVDREEERVRAGDLARGVVGELRTIDNQIMLTQEVVLDASIVAKLKTEIVTNPVTRLANIEVDSRKGTVTLNGSVKTDEQKRETERLARATAGVMTVRNNLKVTG